jgi:16S rRNA processing protein RimM
MGPSTAEVWPDDAVEVGRIAGSWGLKGWIKVQAYADDPQALLATKRWYLKPPQAPGPVPEGGWPVLLRVMQVRDHGDGLIAGIHDLTDREAAEALRGARIWVARSSFPTAGDGEYYWIDLIGLAVRNRQGDELGNVTGLIDTGVHSVLRVAASAAAGGEPVAERLIPFVDAYIDRVDLPGRRIDVDWGLDY